MKTFKRLVGRVIIEVDDSKKVNSEEARKSLLYLHGDWDLLYGNLDADGLEWDSSLDPFADSLEDTKREVDPLGYSVRTQTENDGSENNQLIREMGGALKEAIDLNGFLNRVKNSPDLYIEG